MYEAMGEESISALHAPLTEAFSLAVKRNEEYCVSRKGSKRYTSPLFKLVQCLRSHPALRDSAAADALKRVCTECDPDWAKLFPHVPLPSLEFLTAWDQVQIPDGSTPWQVAIQKVTTNPLKIAAAGCEGYEQYLGLAFHLQRMNPKGEILLPVKRIGEALTSLMGKDVSEQSVSGYSRLARKHGYITLVAKAHHPSGKAARFRFDLSRFTEAGIESGEGAKLATDSSQQFSYGSHGSQGIEGIEGAGGSEASSSSCGLAPAHQKQQETNSDETEEATPNKLKLNKALAYLISNKKEVKGKKKQATKLRSAVSMWQAQMFSLTGWQEKLPADDFDRLKKFEWKTDGFGPYIIKWAVKHWDTFASTAAGTGKEYPPAPNVMFFCKFAHVAIPFLLNAEIEPADVQALMRVCERSYLSGEDLYAACKPDEQPAKSDQGANPELPL